jgi:hypothetical protein
VTSVDRLIAQLAGELAVVADRYDLGAPEETPRDIRSSSRLVDADPARRDVQLGERRREAGRARAPSPHGPSAA